MIGDWVGVAKAVASNNYVSTGISTFVSAWVAYRFAERRSAREYFRAQKEKAEQHNLEASAMALLLASSLETFAIECGRAVEAVQPQGLDGAIAKQSMPPLIYPEISAKILTAETFSKAQVLSGTVGLVRDRLEEQWATEGDIGWDDVAMSATWHFKERGLEALIFARDIRTEYRLPKQAPSDFQKELLDMLRIH
ncbi:hypothetical protein bAD24_I14365 [Burkholderia sp. AD24]|nr:hypothetical protein bAD24_I14365 [Burkholderia sp. AD24]